MIAAQFQIQLFLMQFKDAIASGNLFIIPRDKNNEFLAKYGITPRERETILLSLESKDYEKGPESDHGNPDEDIWVFKKTYNRIDIYIKLKLITKTDSNFGKCLSFHESEA